MVIFLNYLNNIYKILIHTALENNITQVNNDYTN